MMYDVGKEVTRWHHRRAGDCCLSLACYLVLSCPCFVAILSVRVVATTIDGLWLLNSAHLSLV